MHSCVPSTFISFNLKFLDAPNAVIHFPIPWLLHCFLSSEQVHTDTPFIGWSSVNLTHSYLKEGNLG